MSFLSKTAGRRGEGRIETVVIAIMVVLALSFLGFFFITSFQKNRAARVVSLLNQASDTFKNTYKNQEDIRGFTMQSLLNLSFFPKDLWTDSLPGSGGPGFLFSGGVALSDARFIEADQFTTAPNVVAWTFTFKHPLACTFVGGHKDIFRNILWRESFLENETDEDGNLKTVFLRGHETPDSKDFQEIRQQVLEKGCKRASWNHPVNIRFELTPN